MIFSSTVRANRNQQFILIEYLAKRFTYYSHEQWSNKIADGDVCVDGRVASGESLVSAGQTISYDAGEFEEPAADCNYTVIYEDAWLFAVNKPGNLLVHRAGRSFKNNLMYQLSQVHVPPYANAHSIHRLDRNTSGVVLIAKSGEIQATISKQFINRNIEKRYIAFLEGSLPLVPQTISAPVLADTSSTRGCSFMVAAEGKEAITEILLSETLGAHALKVSLRPHTGRTHQLRVHMAYSKHPILGDTTYGAQRSFNDILSTYVNLSEQHPRHALHCEELTFEHPWLKRECTITAPLPEDMQQIEEKLRSETGECGKR